MIEAAGLVDTGELQIFDRVDDLVQVLLREMQIPGCHLQVFMTEKKLDGAQVGSGFQCADASPSCSEPWGVTLLRMPARFRASVQARHTILSVIGCSQSRCIREGTAGRCVA